MFATNVYVSRREHLLELMRGRGMAGVILLMGNSEAPKNYPHNQYAMRQDSTFLYYFGLQRHDLAAILDIDTGEVVLFGDDYSVEDFIWMGPQPSISDQGMGVGVDNSAPYNALATAIEKYKKRGSAIHYLPPYRADNCQKLAEMLAVPYGAVGSGASEELIRTVVSQREIKSQEEIAEIIDACNIGNLMHRKAMEMCVEGVREQDIAGAIEGIALSYGRGVSFHSIVSQRGETLHNHDHSGILKNGKLLLVDAGAENNMNYCSDFTRTWPVGGVLSERQRGIYDIVRRGLELGTRQTKVGVINKEVQQLVWREMIEGLHSVGLMKGSVDGAVESGAMALFMPHGLGHQLGLDVHDMEDLGEKYVGYDEEFQRSTTPGLASLRMGKKFRSGHVVTVEPGIYFVPALIEKWRGENRCGEFINYDEAQKYIGFGGIRLENTILVTDTTPQILGKDVPPLL